MRIELITSDRQSGMLPLYQRTFCIAGQIRTGSLSVPGGVSNQLECCYISQRTFFKSVPAATAGSTLFLLLQLIFYRNWCAAGCNTLSPVSFLAFSLFFSVVLLMKSITKRTISIVTNNCMITSFFSVIKKPGRF